MSKSPRSPKSGAELRRRVLAEHDVQGASQLALLDTACSALDLAVQAERELKRGLVTPGGRAKPEAAIARDARVRLMTALRLLNLEV
jgi:hypothetical protein